MTTERRQKLRRQMDHEMWACFKAARDNAAGPQAPPQEDKATSELRKLRRRAIRHNCEVRMALVMSHRAGTGDVWSDSEHPVKGRILDLSNDGCSVFTSESLEIGQRLSLIIKLRGTTQVATNGMVRWTKGVPQKGGFATGVQFAQLTSKDLKAVRAFLKEMDDTVGL